MKIPVLLALLVLSPGCLPGSHVLTLKDLRPRLEKLVALEMETLKTDATFNASRFAAISALRKETEEKIYQIATEADQEGRDGAEFWLKFTFQTLTMAGVGAFAATGGF